MFPLNKYDTFLNCENFHFWKAKYFFLKPPFCFKYFTYFKNKKILKNKYVQEILI